MANTSPARSLAHVPLANERALYGAVFGKEAAPNTNFSANPSNETLASQLILHHLKRKNNPDDALAAIQGWKEPLKMRTIQQVLDENISPEQRNPSGKKTRNSVEEAKYRTTLSHVERVDRLLRIGYDRLTPSEKQHVLTEVEHALRRIPNVSAYLNNPPAGVSKKECLEQLINNPNFANNLRESVNKKILGGENGEGISLAKTSSEAIANEEETQKLYALKKKELDKLDKKIKATEKKLDDFEPEDPTAVPPRAKGGRYDVIKDGAGSEAILSAKRTEVEGLKMQLNSIMNQLSRYNLTPAQEALLQGRYNLIEQDLLLKQGELTTAEKAAQAYTSAITEQQKLEIKKDELEEKYEEAEKEKIAIEKTITLTSGTLGESKAAREKAEEVFIEGIEDLFKDAALETFESEVQAAQDMQKELVTKAEEEAKSDEKRAIEEAITNRYDETITVHPPFGSAREVRRLRKRRIKGDYQRLISTRGGPEEVMRRVLLSTRIPDKSPGAAIGATKSFTPSEVANALADPEFMKEMQPLLLQQLITRQLQIGRMRSGDVRVFLDSDWGAGMIENALEKNKEFAEEVKRLREIGAVTGPLIEFIRHSRAGSRLSWLMLACGLVPAGFLGAHVGPAIAPALGKALGSVAHATPAALPYEAGMGAAVAGAQALVNRNAA